MATPYIAEISMFGGNFAPRNWAFCDGQLLSIAQNTALFSILGTTYGGNGQTTFAVPDLKGRLPMHPGTGPGLSSHSLGEKSGAESVTLLTTQMPAHSHASAAGSGTAPDSASPVGRYPAMPASGNPYADAGGAQMAGGSGGGIAIVGSSQPHNNLMPSLCVSFIICLQGVFPSRN